MSNSLALRVTLAAMLGAFVLLCCSTPHEACNASDECSPGQTCVFDRPGCQFMGTCANPVQCAGGNGGAFLEPQCDCATNQQGAYAVGCHDVTGFDRPYNPQGCTPPRGPFVDASDEEPPFAIDSGASDSASEASDAGGDADAFESGAD